MLKFLMILAHVFQQKMKIKIILQNVAESVEKGTNIKGSSTASKIIKIVAIVWIVSTIISVIVNLFLL